MNFNMKNRTIALTSAILLSAAAAFAAGDQEVVKEQKSLLEKLDSLQESVLGLKLNGTAKAGALASMASSDQFSENSPTSETQAYSDVNLVLTARPSSETMVNVQLRLHKDWQSGFDENNNPVIGHWFSYDGSILNKHLDFNLGYMRVGYTPLTLNVPQTFLVQEPLIFTEKRIDALAQRNLDTTSRRLLQGLNVDYHSRALGPVDDIHAQLTGARLRNVAKKNDQVFFDFDWSDRYFYGARLGASAFGANLGVNYTDVFDRKKTRRSEKLESDDSVYYENNAIFSIEAGFDSKKMLSSLPVSFGLNGEFAMSKWDADMDYFTNASKSEYRVSEASVVIDDSRMSIIYVSTVPTNYDTYINEDVASNDGKSFYVTPYVKADIAGIEGELKATYLQTDEKFWSEMASAPNYRGNSVVLNANAIYSNDIYRSAIASYGMSSLENMYMAVYNTNPLNLTNLMTSASLTNAMSNTDESQYLFSKVYNNYKSAHFYRNGYDAGTIKALEMDQALFVLDPTVNMAMPFGLATPDRKGFNVELNATWNDAITLNGYFAQVKQDAASNTYTEYAAGISANIGKLLLGDNDIIIQGSYDHAKEDAGYMRSSDRIMAGLAADIYGPVSFLAGLQMFNKKFDVALPINELVSLSKAEELMLLVGPRVKIAPNSYLSVQYGLLKDKLLLNAMLPTVDAEGNAMLTPSTNELAIDKNVIIADITVNF
ncbi:MAG: hypothetical protein MJY82_03350 [Fibrobacter sp.]|nr:hypothetical protein [Fibrobacter sp.]